MRTSYLILIIVITTGLLICSIARDMQLIKLFPGDMRNRIVGARLQKDHKSPYFYRWKTGDSTRYYNPLAFDSYAASPSTASPFFHLLLYPLVEYQQLTINRIWLVLQYGLWGICLYVGLKICTSNMQKLAVLIAGIGILFTEGWISLIVLGQLYLVVSFLGMLFFFFFKKNKPQIYPVCAGIVFIVALLIRPNLLLFFLPFTLLYKNYSLKYKLLFFTPAVILLTWIAASSTQRNLWIEYKRNIDEQIKINYTGNPTMQANAADPHYNIWEGLDMDEIQKNYNSKLITDNWQDVNFFLLVRDIFNTKLSLQTLIGLFFLTALSMCFIFYFYNYKREWNMLNIALFGFGLYMLCDIFSPIHRYQYYAVQWLFPLLVVASIFTSRLWKIYFLIAFALMLNIINASFIKMEHTIGEYLWLASFFCLSLFYKSEQNIYIPKN